MQKVVRTCIQPQAKWLVINTQPQREALALASLEQQGFEPYMPLIARVIRHARRVTHVKRPLFPGYMFVRTPPDQRWHPILRTFGVRSLVRCGEAASTIDDEFVAALKLREIDGVVCKPASPFKVGQPIIVQNPSMEGLVGHIIELRENERIIVLLKLLNQEVRVNLQQTDIRPAL